LKKTTNSKIGYLRVSGKQQDLSLQIDALKEAGVEKENLFIEQVSGNIMLSERPELKKCLNFLKKGDILIVWKFDRLGRSLKDLISIIQELHSKEVTFISLTEKVDTSSPIGSFFFEMIGAFAEFEHSIISERTRAGQSAARKRGVSGGRKDKLTLEQEKLLVTMYEENKSTLLEIQEKFNISKPTIYRYLNKNKLSIKKNRK
jgi:DNA invertase Pin-like site-specific DNA recombinase